MIRKLLNFFILYLFCDFFLKNFNFIFITSFFLNKNSKPLFYQAYFCFVKVVSMQFYTFQCFQKSLDACSIIIIKLLIIVFFCSHSPLFHSPRFDRLFSFSLIIVCIAKYRKKSFAAVAEKEPLDRVVAVLSLGYWYLWFKFFSTPHCCCCYFFPVCSSIVLSSFCYT